MVISNKAPQQGLKIFKRRMDSNPEGLDINLIGISVNIPSFRVHKKPVTTVVEDSLIQYLVPRINIVPKSNLKQNSVVGQIRLFHTLMTSCSYQEVIHCPANPYNRTKESESLDCRTQKSCKFHRKIRFAEADPLHIKQAQKSIETNS